MRMLLFLANLLLFVQESRSIHVADVVAASTQARWMSKLDDALRVNQLSIPGSHDTVTSYKNPWCDGSASVARAVGPAKQLAGWATGDVCRMFARCNDQPMDALLAGGVRAFDIRLKLKSDLSLKGRHGQAAGFSFEVTFPDILTLVANFLEQNPSEFVILMIKDELRSKSLSFPHAVEGALNPFNSVIHNFASTSGESGQAEWATTELRALRGKMVVLVTDKEDLYSGKYMMKKTLYPDEVFDNNYNFWSADAKIEHVKTYIDEVLTNDVLPIYRKACGVALNINALQSAPITCGGAAISRAQCPSNQELAEQVNAEYLNLIVEASNRPAFNAGLTMMDFPLSGQGLRLTAVLIGLNN